MSQSEALRSEADLIRALRRGTYTLEELYAWCEQDAAIERDDGLAAVDEDHAGDMRWKRRVRGALQTMRREGKAERVGRSTWALRGTRQQPRLLVLIDADGTPQEIEMRLQAAHELLGSLEQPADLVLCDPPWGLAWNNGRDPGQRGLYGRNQQLVVDGYVEVDAERYERFTWQWVSAAARALRPAGNLVIVTGPEQSSVVDLLARKAGLTFVSQIVARKVMPLRSLRRPAFAHWTISVLTNGALRDRARVYNVAADLPKAASGSDYPLDWWHDNGRSDRPGRLRYSNSLPLALCKRLVVSFSNRGELVVDPTVGGGTTMIAAVELERRFIGGDINPGALRYSAARLLVEHRWPTERTPRLFEARCDSHAA